MPHELSDKVCLVTGAARGIGLAIAQALANAGCAVAIQDIDFDEATMQIESLKQLGHRAVALGGDICDLSLAPDLIAQTVKQLGGLHILINNGAVQKNQDWKTLTVQDFDRTFHANVAMPMLLSQIAAPIFVGQKWGRIINIGSIQQDSGNPRMLDYAMSKSALLSMTQAIAKDLGPHGVTVNCIAPGYFDTLRNAHHFTSEQDKVRRAQSWPLRRLGKPEDVAGLALLLCSQAGEYITGQSIAVDGGIAL
jgi:NAD(P)-dependent dehydrogenase (short-subunit alcohol dehydrogenase family)